MSNRPRCPQCNEFMIPGIHRRGGAILMCKGCQIGIKVSHHLLARAPGPKENLRILVPSELPDHADDPIGAVQKGEED